MEKAIQFARKFVEAEYEALVANLTERDDAVVKARREEVDRYLANRVRNDLGRSDTPDKRWFDIGEERVRSGSVMPRRIFQIKAYDHPRMGRLYRIYASGTVRPHGKRLGYAANFYATQHQGDLKIVSRYDLDTMPQEGERLQDGSLSWIHHSGVDLETLGDLVEVRQFEPPDFPEELAEYESS